METKPNPGSNTARDLDCTCPVLDNHHGLGYEGIKGLFVYNVDCPLHGEPYLDPPRPQEAIKPRLM